MNVTTVLFDFDGVLVDTEWAIYDAWHRTFRAHGHPLPLEVYTQCIGSDFTTWSAKTHLEELTGSAFDWHALDAKRQEEITAQLAGEGAMPGVVELLSQLKDAGTNLAVVSSSSHDWVDAWLEKTGLRPWFQEVVCRGDAPRIKPAPDLYLEGVRRFGEQAENCLVIEDSLNGVKAANAAGCPVWVVPNRVTAALDFSLADAIFPSLREVAAALRA